MPELPEVEVVRAGLAPAVTGARIAGVEDVDSGDPRPGHRGREPGSDDLDLGELGHVSGR